MKKLGILIALVAFYFLLPLPVFAVKEDDPCLYSGGEGVGKVFTLNCLPIVLQDIILWTLIFAGIVAVVLIIISGIKFITSGGEAKQAEGARKTLTWAIIGLVLILLSFAIIKFIAVATGVSCIAEPFSFKSCPL